MDHLTMLDVSPPEMVAIAHETGFDAVGLRVAAASPGEEPWPMSPGSPMVRETVRRMDATGVRVLDVEVLRVDGETAREDYEATLEVGAELGARYLTVNVDDPDLERASETFAALVAAARPYGIRPLMEPIPYTEVSNLEEAIRVVESSDGGGLLLDTLHFQRYGGTLEQLRSVSPDHFAYLQLCDAPLAPPEGLPRPLHLPRGQSTDGTDLQLESRAMRLLPGYGELPLREMLAALPGGIPISVEAPVLSLRKDYGPLEFARLARRAVEDVISPEPVRRDS
jgi:sugar phosphate isomerase/epimerase